jgi:leucyl/phenylalanyl-tRNA---protein transferase
LIDPALLVHAYREGIFPMAVEDGQIGWFSPDPRGILPLETFRISSRLARVIRQGKFEIVIDGGFEAVMRACAERPDEGTWIS